MWNLAGGYQRDRDGGITPVLAIHSNTAREHLRVFSGGPYGGPETACPSGGRAVARAATMERATSAA